MAERIIKFGLSEQEIDRAIRELEEYKQSVIQKTVVFREKAAEKIAELARSGFDGAIADDLTDDSGGAKQASVKVYLDSRENVTTVIAYGEDAVWVEFGAGVYHNGAAGSSPHPYGSELGFTIGSYGKGKGKGKAWGYYENGKLKLSHGTPAVMPMASALTAVLNGIEGIAREVFS